MRRLVAIAVLTAISQLASADLTQELKDAAMQKASGKMAQKLGLPYPAPAGAAAYIINIKNGDMVSSPVLVQFGLKGAGICPAGLQSTDTGHHHLLIDNPQFDSTVPLKPSNQILDYAKGQTEATVTLAPGQHTLQLLYADWKEQPFNPSVLSDKITITVK